MTRLSKQRGQFRKRRKHRDDSPNENWEGKQNAKNAEIIGALSRIADELKATEIQEDTTERYKAAREVLAIFLVLITVILTYCTFRETREDAKQSDAASAKALENAHWTSELALQGAHIDSANALKQAAVSNASQIGETEKALALSRQAQADTRIQLVADVRLVSGVVSGFSQGKTPKVTVTLKNEGQTAAYEYHGWIAAVYGSYPPKGPLNVRLPTERPSDIGRGDERTLEFQIPLPVTPELRGSIYTKTAAIYVAAGFVYTDQFKQVHSGIVKLILGGADDTDPDTGMLYPFEFPVNLIQK